MSLCSFPKLSTQPWPNRWGFFLPYRNFLLDLIKTHRKVCVAPPTRKGTAQMEEIFFGKYHDSGDYWQVYLDIGEDTATVQVVLDHDDEQLVRDTVWLPVAMLPALATAINTYFAGSRKLVEVVI
jgi:hypothetical protein